MKTLKNNFLEILALFLFSPFLFAKNNNSNEGTPIQIEVIINDLLKKTENNPIPDYFIKSLKSKNITYFYLKNICLVHVAFKDFSSEASMKTSVIVMYKFENGKWKFYSLIPYYYDISLLNKESEIFISLNNYCNNDGICGNYLEISKFVKGEMKLLVGFEGYNHQQSLDKSLILGEIEKVKGFLGDTIIKEYKVERFELNNNEQNSILLVKDIAILKSYTDSLVTIKTTTRKLIKF